VFDAEEVDMEPRIEVAVDKFVKVGEYGVELQQLEDVEVAAV
jgi:hypothetical protein